ncbi:PQQ-binding-like beta-propeller repeat protein [Streptomyces sp. NPDC052042]|uniref:outer membrane protein assembly factor BamB family protein n=1 Tax=Streptomyces sp. NPDC052042 TaxID=3365683 RepID=UPI0037CE9B0B
MEALRQDDPHRIGPYAVLARLRESASAVQYLAHETHPDASGTDADPAEPAGVHPDPVVVTTARPELAALPAFRRRFQAEARTAGLLAGDRDRPRSATPDDGADAEPPWTADTYVPALTLAEAIEIAGPLPERAVRVLGAGLAEALSQVHATGAVFQGLSPRTVLLAENGPRLTAFGPLGAAAAAEARPGGQLSVRLGYLTPEQVQGKEPGPASDLFVLGLLLAYAATGTTPLADGPAAEGADRIARTDPELGAVPEQLRGLVARCLAKDPADRPDAGAVAAELAPEKAVEPAEDGWLPEPLSAAISEQGLRVRELTDSCRPPGAPTDPPTGGAAPAADTGPSDSVPAGALPTDAGTADAVPADARPVDTGTAQLGNIARRIPTTDRPTTQLAVPQQLSGAPGACGTPAAASAPPVPSAPLPLPSQASPLAPSVSPMPPASPTPSASPASSATRVRGGVDRRSLFIGLAAGVAGLAIGGGGGFALASGDAAKDAPAPAPSRSVPTVAGLPPRPGWVYRHPADEPSPATAALWNDRLLVLTGESGASGIDLRTGRRVWTSPEAAKGYAALPADEDLCFVAAPTEFLWLSAKNGKVVHREEHAERLPGAADLAITEIVGSSGTVVWFTGSHKATVKAPPPKKGKKRGKDQQVVRSYLFAHDVARRTELWRVPVPTGRGPAAPAYRMIAVQENEVIMRQTPATLTPADLKAAKGKALFRSFDRKTGKQLWARAIGSVAPAGAATGDEQGLLYAAVGDALQAFETPAGKPRWTLNGADGAPYGAPVVSGTLLHITALNQEVGAVERATGRLRWRRSTEAVPGTAAPAVTLSTTGRTLLASDMSQVTAFAAQDGRRLWKFQDIGAQDPEGPTVTAPYRVLTTGRTAIVQRGRVFYAFPVA